MPKSWIGHYTGHTVHNATGDIERQIIIDFTRVGEEGSLDGICYVSPYESGGGATHGSYYVSGTIDWETGEIWMEGDAWNDQGGLLNWGGYRGMVYHQDANPANWILEGEWYDPTGQYEPTDWYMTVQQ